MARPMLRMDDQDALDVFERLSITAKDKRKLFFPILSTILMFSVKNSCKVRTYCVYERKYLYTCGSGLMRPMSLFDQIELKKVCVKN